MLIKQSEATAARRTVYFTAVNTADDSVYTSTLAGADIQISKAGGATADSLGTATHIATGMFKYELTAGECDTLGELSIRLAKTGVYNDVRVVNIVAFDPYSATSLGLSNLDATVSGCSRFTIAELLDEPDTVETDVTLRAAIRVIAAFAAGKLAGARTGSEVFYAVGSATKARITSTNDSSGNRTSVTVDGTDA